LEEMKEMPTRDVIFVSVNLKTPPTRSVPETDCVVSYEARVVPVPLNVLMEDGFWLKRPQKYMFQSGERFQPLL
jgi:hypothetical protein